MSAQLELWEYRPVTNLGERISRLEEHAKYLVDTIDRNREEAIHHRNGLKQEIAAIVKMVEMTRDKLDILLDVLEQAKGAKKAISTVFAILTFFGLAGVYQVYSWLNTVFPKH